MIELITGTAITLISILIGFQLGKNSAVVTPDVQNKINKIFTKIVPKSDVGPILRPSAEQNYYRDNPQAATEQEVMGKTIDELNK